MIFLMPSNINVFRVDPRPTLYLFISNDVRQEDKESLKKCESSVDIVQGLEVIVHRK